MPEILGFFSNLGWTIFGSVLGFLIPILLTWIKYKKRPELLGVWQSTYQGIDEPTGTWITEEVSVRLRWGSLIFENKNSSHKYKYTAHCTIAERVHIIGRWESIRPGANAYGALILTISAQGNAMYGYWAGPDSSGGRRYGRWVLARDLELLEHTKELLERMRASRLADVSN